MYTKEAGLREWAVWMAQPLSVLTKKYKDLVHGPLDDLVDEIIRDVAPKIVKSIGEQEIDEDVQEYLEGAQEGRFEMLAGEFADPEPQTSEDYKAGYAWGYANASEWDGRGLPPAVKRRVVQEQIKEFQGEVTEQVVIAHCDDCGEATRLEGRFDLRRGRDHRELRDPRSHLSHHWRPSASGITGVASSQRHRVRSRHQASRASGQRARWL